MAAFFTAVVRAPLTGIILVTEMTASFLAFADAQRLFRGDAGVLLRDAPIYDSLAHSGKKPGEVISRIELELWNGGIME